MMASERNNPVLGPKFGQILLVIGAVISGIISLVQFSRNSILAGGIGLLIALLAIGILIYVRRAPRRD